MTQFEREVVSTLERMATDIEVIRDRLPLTKSPERMLTDSLVQDCLQPYRVEALNAYIARCKAAFVLAHGREMTPDEIIDLKEAKEYVKILKRDIRGQPPAYTAGPLIEKFVITNSKVVGEGTIYLQVEHGSWGYSWTSTKKNATRFDTLKTALDYVKDKSVTYFGTDTYIQAAP